MKDDEGRRIIERFETDIANQYGSLGGQKTGDGSCFLTLEDVYGESEYRVSDELYNLVKKELNREKAD